MESFVFLVMKDGLSLWVRFSMGLNVVLVCLLAVLGFFFAEQFLEFAEYADGRPRGTIMMTDRDLMVYRRPSGLIAFTLPKGTILQESTPGGLATLGELHGRDYLLTIHTDEESFSSHSPSEKSPFWADEYSFSKSDSDDYQKVSAAPSKLD